MADGVLNLGTGTLILTRSAADLIEQLDAAGIRRAVVLSTEALDVFADAVARPDPRTRLLYFDVTALGAPSTPDNVQRWTAAIGKLGTHRLLFGSDATGANVTPGDAWGALRKLLPLTDAEFRAIASNVALYMR